MESNKGALSSRTDAFDTAIEIGKLLDSKPRHPRVVGVALAILLGQFVLSVRQNDEDIDAGIDAIATDAKTTARKLRSIIQNVRQ